MEVPSTDSLATSFATSHSNAHSHQPHPPAPDEIKVLHRGRIGDEEVENLLKMKPCSGYKLKDVTSNGIFVGDAKDGTLESGIANLINKTRGHNYQQTSNGMSQISFSAKENISPTKPTSLPKVVKQRELSGTLISELDLRIKKQILDIKCKELNGHDIFIGLPEILPRSSVTTHFLESKESKDMEELVPQCTLSRFLILLKTRVISYLVKNLCTESINGWWGIEVWKSSTQRKAKEVQKMKSLCSP